MALDSISLGILWSRVIGLLDEASAALVRTSFSTLVRESNDFSIVLTDVSGNAMGQASASLGSFVGTLPATVRHFLALFPLDTLQPGDVLVTNDPWMGTGHLPDISIVKPIFHRGRVVAFSASTAHAPDIGGKIRSVEPREVFEEGLQIPPMKLFAGGEIDRTLERIIRKNVRVPDLTMGDLMAQVKANELVDRRVSALVDEYRLDDFTGFARQMQGASERAMRAAIAALPDGTYRARTLTDGLADPVRLEAAVVVSGDEIRVDYAGSSPQVDRALNVVPIFTYSYTAYTLKCILLPEAANNDGCFRPIRASAPEGCILNPRFPAAVGARMLVGHYIPFLILQALSEVVPERVVAAAGSPLWSINYNGVLADGARCVGQFFANGGYGASAQRDGYGALSFPANSSNTPVEMLERISPLRVVSKGLAAGSGGRGRMRGGLGQRLVFRNGSPERLSIIFVAERTKTPAPGMAGGESGTVGRVSINGQPIDPTVSRVLAPGDEVEIDTPGGGGYGPPAARDPQLAARDREYGYV